MFWRNRSIFGTPRHPIAWILLPVLVVLLGPGNPARAQSSRSQAIKRLAKELRQELVKEMKDYAKDEAIQSTADKLLNDESVNRLTDISIACATPISPQCLCAVFLSPSVAGTPSENRYARARHERAKACDEFLGKVFPVWEKECIALAHDRQARRGTEGELEQRRELVTLLDGSIHECVDVYMETDKQKANEWYLKYKHVLQESPGAMSYK